MCISRQSGPVLTLPLFTERPARLVTRSRLSPKEKRKRKLTGILNRVTEGKIHETATELLRILADAREREAASAATSESDAATTPDAPAPSYAQLQTEAVEAIFEYALRLPLYRRIMADFCASFGARCAAELPPAAPPSPAEPVETSFLAELSALGEHHVQQLLVEAGAEAPAQDLPQAASSSQCSAGPRFMRLKGILHFMAELCVAGCCDSGSIVQWCGVLLHACTERSAPASRAHYVEAVLLLLKTAGRHLDSGEGGWRPLMDDYIATLRGFADPRFVGGSTACVSAKEGHGGAQWHLTSRLSFLVLDILELRENGWAPKKCGTRGGARNGIASQSPLYVA